jgi:hypothetical protein
VRTVLEREKSILLPQAGSGLRAKRPVSAAAMDTSAPALHDLPGGRLGASVNPLVADTGTPPIPEAQAWVARYDGAYGPLINMSQAVRATRRIRSSSSG